MQDRPTRPPQSSAAAWQLPALAALVPYALLAWRFSFLTDDSFIAFRYGRNLALGRGLVFNPGESPPVEGYTQLLWILLAGGIETLGLDPTLWMRVLSAGAGAVFVVLLARFASRRLDLGPLPTAVTVFFFACLPATGLWATGGLETMPFALSVFLVFERLLGEPGRPRGVQAGAAAIAAGLFRADGAIFVGLVLSAAAATWLLLRRSKEWEEARSLLHATLMAGVLFAAATVALTAWRIWYYGDYIPNTARVKAELTTMRLERGVNYAATYLLTFPSCALVILLGIAFALRSTLSSRQGVPASRARGTLAVQAIVIAVGNFLYVAFLGGDFMPMGRFLMPTVAFLALIVGVTVAAPLAHKALACAAAGLALIALSLPAAFDLSLFPDSLHQRFHFRWMFQERISEYAEWVEEKSRAEEWSELGRALSGVTRPGESIIRGAIGAVGYYSDLCVYDLYGLTDREVARLPLTPERTSPGHDKKVAPSYFLKDRPTFYYAVVEAIDVPLEQSLPPNWEDLPWSRIVELERHPLGAAESGGPERELRLWRFLRWNFLPEAMDPLLAAVRGIELEDPAAAEAALERRLPTNGPAADRLRKEVLALHRNSSIAVPASGGIAFSMVAPPGPDTAGHQVNVLRLEGTLRGYRVPRGEIAFLLPVSGTPTYAVEGRSSTGGWIVHAPGAAVSPRVEGGAMLLVQLLPGGEVRSLGREKAAKDRTDS